MIIKSSDYNSWLFIFRLFCVVTSTSLKVPYWPKGNASTFCSMCKNALPWLWWCNFCLSGSILFQFSLEKFRTGLCLFKKKNISNWWRLSHDHKLEIRNPERVIRNIISKRCRFFVPSFFFCWHLLKSGQTMIAKNTEKHWKKPSTILHFAMRNCYD